MTTKTTLTSVAITIVAGTWAALATAAPPKPTPVGIKVKPDLVIANAKAERTGFAAGGAHQVKVSATARCSAPTTTPVSCGMFKIMFEYRDGRVGGWTLLGEAGVASLSSGGLTRIVPTATRHFDDTVPAGRTRSYRITVDSMNQVEETNESNNTATTSYRATGCPGTDLVLTRVSMQRATSGGFAGGVAIKVWVKNRCVEACVADIDYVIDVSEAVPGAMGVTQRIATRVDGEAEVGPLGTVVAPGRAGEDLTYTVRIVPRGGACAETSTANNSCRVTIRASEDSRTVRCNLGF